MRTLLFAVFTLLLLASSGLAAEWSLPRQAPSTPSEAVIPALPEGWITVEGTYARFYGPLDNTPALVRLSGHADMSIPAIADKLQTSALPIIHIYVVDNNKDFVTLQPGAPPHWADATAWPQHRLIFLRAQSLRSGVARPQKQVLDHEITHVLLGQVFGAKPIPHWLQEGLAQWFAGEVTPEVTRQITRGSWGRGLIPLDQLRGSFPKDPTRAQLAYAQSADFIGFLATEYGESMLSELVKRTAIGEPLETILDDLTGESLSSIDERWRSRLEGSWLSLEVITSDTFLFALASLALVIGYIGVRLRNRRRLRLWAKREEIENLLWQQTPSLPDEPNEPDDPKEKEAIWPPSVH